MRITPKALVVLAALPLLAAACTVANPFAPAGAADRANAEQMRLKWAQCMRQHGQDVPDPGPDGTIRRTQTSDGPEGGAGAARTGGPNPDSAEFQAAVDACKQYEPNGGQGVGKPDQQTIDQLTKFSQCMRDHGIPMSDPQVQGGGGIGITVSPGPDSVAPDSEQFQAAQKACQQYQPKPRGSR